MKKHLLIPIYLFLYLFLLDKLFYIPQINELFVKNNFNFYDVMFKFENIFYEDFINKNQERYATKNELFDDTIVFLGTSRSEIFRGYSKKDILNNPFCKNEDRIINKPVIAHIIKAGSFFHFYQLFNFAKNKYSKSTLFAIELNYASFNKNSYFRQRKDIENLNFKQFLEIYNYISNKQKIDYITSRLFIVNTKNISFLLPFGEKNIAPEDSLGVLFNLFKGNVKHNNKNTNFNFVGTMEGQENEILLKEYDNFLKNQLETVHLKFKEDHTDIMLFKNLVEDASRNNLKLIFFRPKIHKLMRNVIDKEYGEKEKRWFEETRNYIKMHGYSLVDLESPEQMNCNYFTDPSHLSTSCAPEIVEKFDSMFNP